MRPSSRLRALYQANRTLGGLRLLAPDTAETETEAVPDDDGLIVPGSPTILLYGTLVVEDDPYWGGVSADAFVRALASIDAPAITVRLNSPGGDVFAGTAMAQAIREHPAQVTVIVDGYAASAASIVMIAADSTLIAPGGFVMIHNAWTLALGDAGEMRATADLLEQIDASIAQAYTAKAGDGQDWRALMDAETWMGADRAIAMGLCDALAPSKTKVSALAFDLSAFAHPPERPTSAVANAADPEQLTVAAPPAAIEPIAVNAVDDLETQRRVRMTRARLLAPPA